MRAIIIFKYLLILAVYSCTSIEVAKEVTKATNSIKTSIEKISIKKNEENNIIKEEDQKNIEIEKEKVVVEKKTLEKTIQKQKKLRKINFIGNSLKELKIKFGDPNLFREDGKTRTVRFDTKSCRIFFYFDLFEKNSIVKYYELRNLNGDLLNRKIDVDKCYEEISLV